MITFIVTTYNLSEWLIRRCLHSIVAQGLARDEYEIIVVDDESEISPQAVVDEFLAQADVTLYVQKHARQGAARNLGLRHAKGEWVQFVDGDDYLFANTIKPCLALAKEKELDMLMFGFQEVFDVRPMPCLDDSHTKALSSITTGNDYMLKNNLFGSCCMQLFQRLLLEEPQYGAPLRFSEGIYIEDEEFVTKLVWRAQRLARVDMPVYAYYQRSGSTVHSRSREHTDELFNNYFIVLARLLDFESSLVAIPHEGVTRKIRFLAIDILRRSLREPDWKKRWRYSAQHLKTLGLYPIPYENYSLKYKVFRLLAACGVGRYMLRLVEK